MDGMYCMTEIWKMRQAEGDALAWAAQYAAQTVTRRSYNKAAGVDVQSVTTVLFTWLKGYMVRESAVAELRALGLQQRDAGFAVALATRTLEAERHIAARKAEEDAMTEITWMCPECGRELEHGDRCPECGKRARGVDVLAEEIERGKRPSMNEYIEGLKRSMREASE